MRTTLVLTLGKCILAVAAGSVTALVFPEPSLWWLAPLALVPGFVVVGSATTNSRSMCLAFLVGASQFLAVHHWLAPKASLFILVLSALAGTLWLPFGPLCRQVWLGAERPGNIVRAVVLIPCAWTVMEYVRSWESLGGPWGILGNSQWNGVPFLDLAALGGVWAISFILVMINVAVYMLVALTARTRRTGASERAARRQSIFRLFPLTVLSLIGVIVLGIAAGQIVDVVLGSGDSTSTTLRVIGVQPGVIDEAMDRFEASLHLTSELEPATADLIIWGESSVGFDPVSEPREVERIIDLSSALKTPIIINVDARRTDGSIAKEALIVDETDLSQRYTKMRLVPFGEYIPLRGILHWISEVVPAAREDRSRGSELAILRASDVDIGILICFESSFPDMTRNLANDGAQLIVVQSATTTFQDSWAPEQHASLAALRAVESGRPVIHATISGVSTAFDVRGNKLTWIGTDFRGPYTVDVELANRKTLYAKWGDWVPRLCILILLSACIAEITRKVLARGGTKDATIPTNLLRGLWISRCSAR